MLEIRGKDFYLDNEKFHIYSGAIHYFRMLRNIGRIVS